MKLGALGARAFLMTVASMLTLRLVGCGGREDGPYAEVPGDGAAAGETSVPVDSTVERDTGSTAVARPPGLDPCFAQTYDTPRDAAASLQPQSACQGNSLCTFVSFCELVDEEPNRNGLCLWRDALRFDGCNCAPTERCVEFSARDERAPRDSGACRQLHLCITDTCYPDTAFPYDCSSAPRKR